jgi:hypothetical protein
VRALARVSHLLDAAVPGAPQTVQRARNQLLGSRRGPREADRHVILEQATRQRRFAVEQRRMGTGTPSDLDEAVRV